VKSPCTVQSQQDFLLFPNLFALTAPMWEKGRGGTSSLHGMLHIYICYPAKDIHVPYLAFCAWDQKSV